MQKHKTPTKPKAPTLLSSFFLPAGYGGYRLANGSTTCSGRVELLHGGTWGTLCDYLWDLPAANDLCQQLNCGVALQIPDGQPFGKGNGSVWNGTFSCKKDGSHLRDCSVSVLGRDECPAGKDARVVCSGEQWKSLRAEQNSFFCGKIWTQNPEGLCGAELSCLVYGQSQKRQSKLSDVGSNWREQTGVTR